jgi:hypothetical protein
MNDVTVALRELMQKGSDASLLRRIYNGSCPLKTINKNQTEKIVYHISI